MVKRRDLTLELENISRILDNKLIIDNVSWKVKKREHWAMLGANGAGKTTLMKIIAGYLWPTKGKVTVLGKKFGTIDLRELRKSIGYVSSVLLSEVPLMDPVLEVVLSGRFASLGLYDTPSRKDLQHAKNLLGVMSCSKLMNREFGKLSQGEQQKVLIARALMTKPGILILDEPTIGLDPAARKKFLKKVEKIGRIKNGPTLVYITHHIEEIIPIFENVIVLKKGKVLAKGPREEVLTSRILSNAFNIKIKVTKKEELFLMT